MKNISIKAKLLLIVFLSITIISVVLSLESIVSMENTAHEKIDAYRIEAYKSKEIELKNYISLAYKTIEYYYSKTVKEKMPLDDIELIQKEALLAISEMRYGKDGYFWINDTDTKMLMHPINPSLNGNNLSNIKDSNGKYIYKEIVSIANNKDHGLTRYLIVKPNEKIPSEKFSYVRKFAPWNWVIGTGAYVDEIEDNVNKMIEKTNKDIQSFIITIVLWAVGTLILLLIVSTFIAKKAILEPLDSFQDGLLNFFKYLNREVNTVTLLDDSSKDELGIMSKVVNENIEKTKKAVEEDRHFIDETITVLSEFEQGDLCQRISTTVENPALIELKNVLNSMGSQIENNIENVLDILEQYSHYNYLNKVDNSKVKNQLLDLVNGVNYLGDSITSMLSENKKVGLDLDNSSNTLLKNVNILNGASTEAAASLEETAAALEEITGTIISNTDNVSEMAQFANSVVDSVKEGNDLANQTTQSMDEINEEVTAINDAIVVIDQIAFQTNILSLNAAVEAATAGEAGKGFAVVAQEVRNLASRSSEAAKEIKELVENANSKTIEGKSISTKMITGYKSLNENINKTIELIKDVEMASQEQKSGIEQINDAVTSQDQQTQQIASAANQTYEIAIETSKISNEIVESVDSKKF